MFFGFGTRKLTWLFHQRYQHCTNIKNSVFIFNSMKIEINLPDVTVIFELWHHFHIESWFLSILIDNWKKLCLLRHSLCELRLMSVVTKKTYYVLRGVLSPSIFPCIQIVLNYSSSSLVFPKIVRPAGERLEHESKMTRIMILQLYESS